MVRYEVEERSPQGMDEDDQDDFIVGNEPETALFPFYRAVDGWDTLPEVILEEVFRRLQLRDRYCCSMVCKCWYSIFYSPRIWRYLEFTEDSFTYTKQQMFGYEVILSQNRLKCYLVTVGKHVRQITIPPTFNFHNLYSFCTILTSFLRFFEGCRMPHLHTFQFTFACESRIPIVGPVVLGTGGRFLEQLAELLRAMKNLRHLALNFLLLEAKDVPEVLLSMVSSCSVSLVYLEILDLSKEVCPLFHIGMLQNLRKLVITPQHVNDDVLLMLADSTQLAELIFVQDKYTVVSDSVSSDTWKRVHHLAPWLRVRLQVSGNSRSSLLLQPKAPVWCIIEDTPYARIHTPDIHRIVDNYRNTLHVYGHLMLPKRHGPRSFHHRGDAGLVALMRHCPHLEKLYIRERVSTATLLIIAHEGKSLKELCVRKNAVILRSDWPKPVNWEEWRYKWLQKTARSFDDVQNAISLMLNTKWSMLSDVEYKKITFDF